MMRKIITKLQTFEETRVGERYLLGYADDMTILVRGKLPEMFRKGLIQTKNQTVLSTNVRNPAL